MRTRATPMLAMIFSFSLVLAACGGNANNLTRDRALALIRKSDVFKRGAAVHFEVGQHVPIWPKDSKIYAALAAAGFLEITPNPGYVDHPVLLTISGGERAQNLGGCWPTQCLQIPFATAREATEVTGITKEQGMARAAFTWRWILNEVGKTLAKNGISDISELNRWNGFADFQLYDDGWRLGEIAICPGALEIGLPPPDCP